MPCLITTNFYNKIECYLNNYIATNNINVNKVSYNKLNNLIIYFYNLLNTTETTTDNTNIKRYCYYNKRVLQRCIYLQNKTSNKKVLQYVIEVLTTHI
jgi:hypothetical protein